MRYGAHSFLWFEHWTDASLPMLAHVRALGVDFLEIGIGDGVHFDPAPVAAEAQRLGLALIVSPGVQWPMECDLSLPSVECQQLGLKWHQRQVDFAAALGATAYTGALYGHPGHVERRLPTHEEYQRIATHLHTLAAYAQARGVSIVLEPMSHFRTHLVNRPDQLIELITLAAHPNLGLLLDTYHLVSEVRDYAAAIRTAAPRLWGLHACESDRGVPGDGLVPWPQIATALRDLNFTGYIGLESYSSGAAGFAPSRGLFDDPCPDGDTFVREGRAFLRNLLAP